jgi:hypothetical protein
MRTCCHVLPSASIAILAACGSPGDAHVQLHPVDGFAGPAALLVHHADGTLASRATISDALDVAIDDGDSITIVLHDAGGTFVDTRTQLHGGDEIDASAFPLTSGAFVDATVTMPALANATTWFASGPQAFAESGSDSFTMSVPAGRASVPVFGAASDATHALALYGTQDATIDPSAPAIDLSQPLDFATTTVTITGAPAGASIGTGADLSLGDDDLWVLSDAAPGTIELPTSFADRIDVSGAASGPSSSFAGAVFAHAAPATISLDLSVSALPQLSAPAVTANHVSWTATGGGRYDTITAYASSSATPVGQTFEWRFVAPPGTTSIALPTMPSDVAVPTLDTLDVMAYERSDLDGYGAFNAATGDAPAGASWQERTISIQPSSGVATRASRGKLDPRAVLDAHRR